MERPPRRSRSATPLHLAALQPAHAPPQPTPPGPGRDGGRRRTPERDLLAAGPLQRLAGVSAVGGVVALLLVLWIGRAELPQLIGPRAAVLIICLTLASAVVLTAGFILLVVAPTLNKPAADLAEVAEAVAAGDLTLQVNDVRGAGQLNRVWRAVGRMLVSLRRLATGLRMASRESAELAMRITHATEEMAERAQETAHTSMALSRESDVMAGTIDAITADAVRLTDIAADVAMGAQEGVMRNEHLRALAGTARGQLDASGRALAQLGAEIHESATAVGELAQASEEIRSFVELVRRMAKQSKLLALNAAMEAARAGHEGDGFAVVATEVRRLAADSTEAARRSERAVAAILDRVEASRALAARSVATVDTVLAATSAGEAAYRAVEEAVAAADDWTRSVEESAAHSSRHVHDITERLDALARGTQSFAGAVQGVAASSERQSATTQEVAAAAAELTEASRRLDSLVGTFQL